MFFQDENDFYLDLTGCSHLALLVFITYIKRHATDTGVNSGSIGRGIVLVAVILLQTKVDLVPKVGFLPLVLGGGGDQR